MITNKIHILKGTLAATMILSAGCASLLMLPDEQTEGHYKSISQIDKAQVTSKMKTFSGAKLATAPEGKEKVIRILPSIYKYDVANTLGKNEEAYYTSIFDNSSGSWLRQLLVRANNTLVTKLEGRGYKSLLFSNKELQNAGAQEVSRLLPLERRDNNPVKAISLNPESESTNLAITDRNKFYTFVTPDAQGVAYMEFDTDWEPSSANRLNGDIVLNTKIKIGFKLTVCGKSGCSTAEIPFKDGVTVDLFMPNRNTIDDDGLDKNYALIRDLHEKQLEVLITEALLKFDQMGVFAK